MKKYNKGNLKQITIPPKSVKLAEFVGIILGDGNIHFYKKGKKIGTYMIRIALDKIKDKDYYTNYIPLLGKNLFGLAPKYYFQGGNQALVIYHSRKLVDFFIDMGLKPGSKKTNQTTIPLWIWEKDEWLRACIRGLLDTDGSFYEMKPHWPGLYQITLENFNITLLRDARNALIKLGFKVSKICGNRTEHGTKFYITRKDQINKFYKEIGFSNLKHKQKILQSPVV